MNSSASGFTLIELLVVIAVLSILMSITLVVINPAARMGEARDAERKVALREMANALEAYYTLNGQYPSTGGGWWCECENGGSRPRSGPSGYIPNLAPDWVKLLPTDPRLNNGLCSDSSGYFYCSNGTDYKLLAHCTPENYPSAADNPFYDPRRPTYSWAVWSSDASKWW